MNSPGRFFLVTLLLLSQSLESRPSEPERTFPPEPRYDRSYVPPSPTETRLSNGMRVLVVERYKIPLVHVIWGIRSGAAADPPGLPGTAAMLAEMLTGAVASDGRTLEQRLRERGVVLQAEVNRDRSWYSMQLPRGRLRWSLRTLERALRDPIFSESAVGQVRKQISSVVLQEQGEPERIRALAEWLAIFGEDHPYGRPIGGTAASLNEIERRHLRVFHRDHYRPDNTFLIVSGDVRSSDLVPALDKSIGRRRTPAYSPASEDLAPRGLSQERAILLIDLPGSTQAQISTVSPLGGEVGPLDSGASVMNTLLGGSAGSRLNRSLRGEYGYAYGASSRLEQRRLGGFLSAWTTVSVTDAPEALRQLALEVERMREEPSEEETARARRYLEYSFLASFETNRSITRLLARIESMEAEASRLQGFLTAIREVAPQQVALSGRRCVNPEQMSLVVVGDREALEQPLRQLGLGPVRSWSIDELWGAERDDPSADESSPTHTTDRSR